MLKTLMLYALLSIQIVYNVQTESAKVEKCLVKAQLQFHPILQGLSKWQAASMAKFGYITELDINMQNFEQRIKQIGLEKRSKFHEFYFRLFAPDELYFHDMIQVIRIENYTHYGFSVIEYDNYFYICITVGDFSEYT